MFFLDLEIDSLRKLDLDILQAKAQMLVNEHGLRWHRLGFQDNVEAVKSDSGHGLLWCYGEDAVCKPRSILSSGRKIYLV